MLNFKSKNCAYLDFFKQLGRLSVSNSSTQVMEWTVGLRESWNHSDFFKQQKNIVKREPTITGKTFIHQSDMRVAYHMGPLYFFINYIELFIFSSRKVLGIPHSLKGRGAYSPWSVLIFRWQACLRFIWTILIGLKIILKG